MFIQLAVGCIPHDLSQTEKKITVAKAKQIKRNYQQLIQKRPHTKQKSDNLQYNALGCLVTGANEWSTERLLFQALFFHDFFQNSLQKTFN